MALIKNMENRHLLLIGTRLHIMLSYQWDVKQEVLQVRQRLREAGFRVWIDVEQMSTTLCLVSYMSI